MRGKTGRKRELGAGEREGGRMKGRRSGKGLWWERKERRKKRTKMNVREKTCGKEEVPSVLVGRERREEDEIEREDRKEEMTWLLVGRERREEDESEKEDRKEEVAWGTSG